MITTLSIIYLVIVVICLSCTDSDIIRWFDDITTKEEATAHRNKTLTFYTIVYFTLCSLVVIVS